LSGPDELRKGVLQSVLTWHFDKSEASSTRTVNVAFVKQATTTSAIPKMVLPANGGRGGRGGSGGMLGGTLALPNAKLDRIDVMGISDGARSELLSRLPIHEGDDWSGQIYAEVTKAVKDFDSHLTAGIGRSVNGGIVLSINLSNAGTAIQSLPTFTSNNVVTSNGQGSGLGVGFGYGGAVPQGAPLAVGGVYSVGNGTTPPTVLSKVDPQYSQEALAAKYSGSVMLSIVVGTDGKAQDIKVVKSLGMGLDEKAVEAVLQWVFRPGMNQGAPVNVRAQIEVNFRLPPSVQ